MMYGKRYEKDYLPGDTSARTDVRPVPVRIRRDSFTLYIYASDLSKVLTTHDVTWMRRDSFCRDQYVTEQPEEVPSMPVKTRIFQIEPTKQHSGFEKFNFEEGLWDE